MNREQSSLSVHDLSFSFPDYPGLEGRELFSGLSFALPRGSVTVLLGTPDSGKTTLCRIVLGLVPRFTGGALNGNVRLPRGSVDASAPYELIEQVGSVFQNPVDQLFASRCDLEVAFALESLGWSPSHICARVEEALSWMGLEAMSERNPLTLSGGEKKKLLLACLFAVDPQLWLLDETLEELDEASRIVLLEHVKKRGKTVLLASAKWHDVFGEYADRVLLLEDGAIEPLAASPGSRRFTERLEAMGLILPGGTPGAAHLAAGAEARAGAGAESGHGESVAAGAISGDDNGRESDRTRGGPSVIEVRGLSFRYHSGESFHLEVPSLEIRAGEVVALIGDNGSGKTTLGRILCGLLEPQKGSVEIRQGEELRPAAAEQLNRYTGYLFQDPDLQIFLPTVADELGYGLRLRGLGPGEIERIVSDAIGRFRLPAPEVPPALMSYGSRKRLQAAVCYLLERPVLVVDEGDSGLGATEFAGLLRQLRSAAHGPLRGSERGLMFITHDMQLARRLADRVVRLREGKPE